jgi:hypothetical protein
MFKMRLVNMFLTFEREWTNKQNMFGEDVKIVCLSDAGFLFTLQGYFYHHKANNYKQFIYSGVINIIEIRKRMYCC